MRVYDTNKGPGRVSVRLTGTITHGGCRTFFHGHVNIDDDEYDFDERPYGERDGGNSWFYLKENSTRLGGSLPGENYTITFDKEREVDASSYCHPASK